MTRCGELQEAYEGAVFALLIDYVMEFEGEETLEGSRILREDPGAEVPQGIRQTCLREIHRTFQKRSA